MSDVNHLHEGLQVNYQIFDDINKVEGYWLSFGMNAPEKYYQSYEFNLKCCENRRTSISNILRGNTSCKFVVFFDGEECICIAPLIIDRYPNKAVRLLGHGTNAGVLDFVYRDSLKDEKIKSILSTLVAIFPGYDFDFIFVHEESKLFPFLEVIETFENFMVSGSDYESWFAGLSKKTRQNIRTAYNRMNSDGITYSLGKTSNSNIDETLVQEIDSLYQERRQAWGVHTSRLQQMMRLRSGKRDIVYRTITDSPSGVVYRLMLNDKCAAFFAGYQFESYIHVPRLAIDDSFGRYSPGMVLINECLKQFEGMPFKFNLGRGSEGYKKNLNGVPSISIRGTYSDLVKR